MTKKKHQKQKNSAKRKQRKQAARKVRQSRSGSVQQGVTYYTSNDGTVRRLKEIETLISQQVDARVSVLRGRPLKDWLLALRGASSDYEWQRWSQDLLDKAVVARSKELGSYIEFVPLPLVEKGATAVALPQMVLDALIELDDGKRELFITREDEVLTLLRKAVERGADVGSLAELMVHTVAAFQANYHSDDVARLDPDVVPEWKNVFGHKTVRAGALILGAKQWLKWDVPMYEHLEVAMTSSGTVDFSDVKAA